MPEERLHPRPRLLIVDDQEQTRYVFRRILTGAGFDVSEAKTGREGLMKAAELPDVIISDVNLPDMLGYDLCRRLKADAVTCRIPVLQISASFISDESKVQALQGGADSYLVQPVEPSVLVAQVQALLRLRKAEAQSGIAAKQWQTTFNSLSDGLALIDLYGTVTRTNRTFLHLLETTPSEVEGRPIAHLFHEIFGLNFEDFRRASSEEAAELQFRGRWLRVRCNLITGDMEQAAGAILLLTDITQYKKLQETLKMSERLAATGRLAHIIAHEINNPLEALSNLLYLVGATGELSADQDQWLSQASRELDRISQITKQILAYHRDSHKPLPATPRDVVEGVLAMFRSRMISTGVELISSFRCSEVVRIHPGEVRQAFGNLISNALDAIGGQGGILRVHCNHSTDLLTGRPGVRFIFSDTGDGIPPEVMPKIFGAFFTTKEAGGSGIGLWLTMEAILKHHGRMRVRSRTSGPYRGTIFDVFLPFEGPDVPDLDQSSDSL